MDDGTKELLRRAVGCITAAGRSIADACERVPDFDRTVRGDLDRAAEHLRKAVEWLNTAQSQNHEVDQEIRFLARIGPVKE